MAASSSSSSSVTLLSFLLLLLSLLAVEFSLQSSAQCFDAIFSFGDSISDTGNLIRTALGENNRARRFPYGETYFHRPTGRFTDGRLIVDFIAQAMGLPLLPPYLAGPGGGGFEQGVNFAVAGATALENGFFREEGMVVDWTEYSLGDQIQWFKALLPSIYPNRAECKKILKRSIFLVGEIGGNDYNYAFGQGRTLDKLQTFAPKVVNTISSAITTLIELGARTLVVPGDFPIGCIAVHLTHFQTSNSDDYDPISGCLKWLNEFSVLHNQLLQDELGNLRRRHPHVTIIYADYYEAGMTIFRAPLEFGFEKVALPACCGAGGPYNYNASTFCGKKGTTVCDDPSRYICWDGKHLTEAAYKIIANGLLEGPFATPPIGSIYPLKNSVIDSIQ